MPPDPDLKELQGQLIDAACEDRAAADALIAAHPELLSSLAHLGETALHFCIVENFLDAARYLLGKGAAPDVRARQGSTALLDACAAGNADAVRLLLEFGADPTVRGSSGDALETALAFERYECAVVIRNLRPQRPNDP